MAEQAYTRFHNFINDNRLLKPREKVILGVSGGPDSIFLFHMFLRLRQEQKNDFVVAHFNHCLRKEAAEEEEFVGEVCGKNNIRFISEAKDVRKIFKGDSLEQTARNLRLDFFLKLSRRYKIKKVALAHHKDDLVETVLLRIIRGSGLLGLRGMLPISKYKKIMLIRPLLSIEKQDILRFLKKNKIRYVLDKSNLQDVFLRNKIRLNLLPHFTGISSSFKDNIYNLSKAISWDYDFIYEQTKKIMEEAVIYERPYGLEISSKRISSIHRSLLNNLIRLSIEKVKGGLRRIESKHIEEIADLLYARTVGSVVDIPDIKVTKKPDSLVFKRVI